MLLQLFLTFSSVAAFVPLPQLSPCINGPLQSIVPSLHRRHHNCRDRVTRFETDKDFEVPVSREVLEPKKTVDSATRSADTIQAIQAKQVEDEQKYPLDVPSPILLGTSIFLAIASVGSLNRYVVSLEIDANNILTSRICIGHRLPIFFKFFAVVL